MEIQNTNQSGSTSVFFIRHSERADQVENCNQAIEIPQDPPITANGFELARATGEYLKDWINKFGYTEIKIVSSPFIRTLQTAAEVARVLGEENVTIDYMMGEALYT